MSTTLAVSNIPRVTEILKPFTGIDFIPKDVLEKAAARGTSVHALCAGIAKGAWIPDGMIGENLLGYVNSFKLWSEAQVDKFVTIEKRFTDEDLKFTGQLDFVILGKDGNLYLVDLKTSASHQKSYPIQMAAYDYLLEKHKIKVKGAMLVYLNKDGEFPNIHYLEDMQEERSVFMGALTCWHYFHKRKIKQDGNS
jgi:hypothetical protein